MLILNKNMPVAKKFNNKKNLIFKDNKYTGILKSKKIVVLNLMPNKIKTEYHLLRFLAEHEDFLIEPFFLKLETHNYKNTNKKYLDDFYISLEEAKKTGIDAAIITGAPVEKFLFEEVGYWEELKQIFDFVDTLKSSIFICWGAQAALYYFYNIPKYEYKKKKFGVFKHEIENFSELFSEVGKEEILVPHSRYTYNSRKDIVREKRLEILLSDESGEPVISTGKNKIFISGHMEYDRHNLKDEYTRDIANGLNIGVPENYFKDNNPDKETLVTWEVFSKKFYKNWLGKI